MKTNRKVNELIDNYSKGEAKIKELEMSLVGRNAQQEPDRFKETDKAIENIETGNRSVVKQLSEETKVSEYNVIEGLSAFIDNGRITLLDFYNNINV